MTNRTTSPKAGIRLINHKETTDSAAASVEAAARGPQLRISHLLLWTLYSAVFLALARMVQQSQGGLPDDFVKVQQLAVLVASLVLGGVLAGATVLGWNRVRTGPPLFRQPGHWLIGAVTISVIDWSAFLPLLPRDEDGPTRTAVVLVYGTTYILPGAIYCHAVFCNSRRRWKLAFAAMAGMQVLQVIWLVFCVLCARPGISLSWIRIISVVFVFSPVVCSLWMGGLMLLELLARERRGWLHWIGVGAFILWVSRAPLLVACSWVL